MKYVEIVLDTKPLVEELNIQWPIDVHSVGTHANDIHAVSGGSFSMEQEFYRVVLDDPITEQLTMPLWIVGCQTELFVISSDDMS